MLDNQLSDRVSNQLAEISSSTTLALSRREVFRLIGALCLASPVSLSFLGCNKSNPEPDQSLADPPTLAQLRDLIRSSADHLQARAEEVVVTKDVRRITEFVRDHIAVLPPFHYSDDASYASRWGMNGTLRAGAGTLRDRAELLVAMLGAAGIAAKVREMPTPSRLNAYQLYRPRPHDFSADQATLTAMVKAIQKKEATKQKADAPKQPKERKETGAAAQDVDPASLVNDTAKMVVGAIAGTMANLEPAEFPVPPHIPVVTLDGDSSKVLVALDSMAVETGDVNKLITRETYERPKIEFSVTAFLNPRLGGGSPRVVELVKSSWPVEDVVGHQVQVLFAPPQGAKALLAAPLSSYPLRVPIIRVQSRPSGEFDARKVIFGTKVSAPNPTTGDSAPSAEAAEPSLLATGSLFTIDGEILNEVTPEPSNSNPRLLVLDDAQAQAASQRVTKLEATINAASFPEIEVALSVTDAKGGLVDGLGMSAFAVKEGTQPCRPILVANRQIEQKPRILVLYDGSGSMDEAFGSKENRQTFNKLLAQTLIDAAVAQPLDVQVVGLGSGSYPGAWKPPSIDQLTKDMELFSFSDLWTSFTSGALDDGPAAVIIVSDYDISDAGQAAAKLRLTRAQIPILAITPVKVKEEVLSDLLTVSGAQRFAVTDPKLKTALKDVVAKAITTKRAYSYRFHYRADLEGPNPRSVQVALASHPQIRTSAIYQVPAQEVRVPPASVAGLYLTISVGGQRERRHLGGVRFSEGGYTRDDPNNAAVIAEARNALNGLVTVTVEPGSPTIGAVLEDVVTSFQSLEPLLKNKEDTQAFMAAAGRFYRYPLELAQLLEPQPPSDRTEPVVSQGLRILVSTEQPKGEGVISRIDIPPALNRMRHITGGVKGMPNVVRSSLWLSINESLAYEQSAFTQLHGRPLHLVNLNEGVPSSILEKLSPEIATQMQRVTDQYGDYIRLVPTDGGPIAMWVVDPRSGTVMAVGSTGRGEGSSIIVAKLALVALSHWLIYALTWCEAGGEKSVPWTCVGAAGASIALTAGTALALSHYSPLTVLGESIVIGNGLFGIYQILDYKWSKYLMDVFDSELFRPRHHANPTAWTVFICMLHVVLWANSSYHVLDTIKSGPASSDGPPAGQPTTSEPASPPEVCKDDTDNICEFHPPMAPSPSQ